MRGIESGPVPGPWQIDFRPTDIHVSNTHYVRIPNTEQVQVNIYKRFTTQYFLNLKTFFLFK